MKPRSTCGFFTLPKVSVVGLKRFKNLAAIIAEAKARPRLKPDQCLFEGFPPGSVMTEAGRLARNIAKDELKRRGIKLPWEVDANEITKIANTLLEADLNIIGTAKANLEKRATNPANPEMRRARPRRM